MGHEASGSKISEDRLFYLMSRSMTEDEAAATVVRGFVEPIANRPGEPSARSLVSPAQPVASGPHTGSDEASPRRVPALLAH